MNVLVPGGYGLIGSAVVRRLAADGHHPIMLGRTSHPPTGADWRVGDLRDLCTPASWAPLLAGVDAVVNAAGALQDGPGDDLEAVHHLSIAALVAACEAAGVLRFVQISAAGADAGSMLPFFASKGRGDAAVMRSALDWTVLRPGLVISPAAYGGTALLRALAAFPFFVPVTLADRPVQTVSADDLCEAVSRALDGRMGSGRVVDLVEERPHRLADVLVAFRVWLGLRPAPLVVVSDALGRAAALVADGLGRLGWRSPLCSAAMAALMQGIRGDPADGVAAIGRPLRSLEESLRALPSTVQERWFARLWLLKPAVLGGLSLFWIVSGIVGLLRAGTAAALLTNNGFNHDIAQATVFFGSLVDMLVGAAVLVRRLARPALLAMAGTTLFYLSAASIVAPALWLDPLGPLVKALPSLLLVLVALAILDDR